MYLNVLIKATEAEIVLMHGQTSKPGWLKLCMYLYLIGADVLGYRTLTSVTSEAAGGHSTLRL